MKLSLESDNARMPQQRLNSLAYCLIQFSHLKVLQMLIKD